MMCRTLTRDNTEEVKQKLDKDSNKDGKDKVLFLEIQGVPQSLPDRFILCYNN